MGFHSSVSISFVDKLYTKKKCVLIIWVTNEEGPLSIHQGNLYELRIK